MNINALKKSFCLIALLSLTGCSAALKQMDLGIPGLSPKKEATKNISVDQLLAQARGQTSSQENSANPSELVLNFTELKEKLSTEQKERLNRFANLQGNLMQVECALGSQTDRFTATNIAISRCTKISQFLTQRARETEVSVRPDLSPDLVKVSQ